MGLSDNSRTRRNNRRIRRKQETKQDASSKVSSRVAAIIAMKNRRKTGRRRMCQGMCFTIPTPEDPFNDKQGKADPIKKRKRDSKANGKSIEKNGRLKRGSNARSEIVEKGKSALIKYFSFMGPEIAINLGKPTFQVINSRGPVTFTENNTECPSKYLLRCLDSIQNYLQNSGALVSEEGKPIFGDSWGLQFWNCYTHGKDVLETDAADSRIEQIAWMSATAADTISMKEKEGLSFTSPFLLYLVPSQEKASKVREVCKPLKALGIHTVSLHSGASIDHQINGLKSCEPEFLVSTPERLLELLDLNAVDTSGVSLLVIDGLEAPFSGTYFDAIKSVRKSIPGSPKIVVFCDCSNNSSDSVVQKLQEGS